LVFTRTKRGADRVCKQLKQSGIAADALHGNKAQNARVRALEAFRTGKVRVLVATDIAARGIDVPNISHVINYELPNEPESYVHRIGRTARAGAEGAALSFCDQSERPYLRAIEKLMRRNVTVVEHRLAEAASQAGVEIPRRSCQRPAPAAKPRRQGRTRSPRIAEIPMLATPASQRHRTSHRSGEGHR
ncbi:MAG: helicase-related protein, partial [Actinomycetota bacterium]